jgi:hypothetical protein
VVEVMAELVNAKRSVSNFMVDVTSETSGKSRILFDESKG